MRILPPARFLGPGADSGNSRRRSSTVRCISPANRSPAGGKSAPLPTLVSRQPGLTRACLGFDRSCLVGDRRESTFWTGSTGIGPTPSRGSKDELSRISLTRGVGSGITDVYPGTAAAGEPTLGCAESIAVMAATPPRCSWSQQVGRSRLSLSSCPNRHPRRPGHGRAIVCRISMVSKPLGTLDSDRTRMLHRYASEPVARCVTVAPQFPRVLMARSVAVGRPM